MKRRYEAFSLVELVTVMAIVLILAVTVMPSLRGLDRDSRFERFAAELAGHFQVARRYAQLAEATVSLDFGPHDDAVYGCYLDTGQESWQLLSRHAIGRGYEATIRNALPDQSVKHPTTGKPLTQPVSSLHAPEILFTAEGGSGGNVIFSDAEGRVLCVVVSSGTGRFRVYIRSKRSGAWRRYA